MKQHLLFTKEQVNSANQVNLIEFAISQGYILENGGRRAFHVKQSGGLYLFKNSNRYFHFSSNTHGGAIDFAIHFCNMTFKEAVTYLLKLALPQKIVSPPIKERGQLILPDKASNYRRVAWYLIQIRGIAPEIVSLLMQEKKVYQQDKTGNCVFVGYDQEGFAKYCSMRGTTPSRPFKQDREYSDKSYPFHLSGHAESKLVYVCESPIDAMSRASIAKIRGQDWKTAHYISLGCLSNQALERFLHHNQIKEIVFCLDNDSDATYSNGSPAPNWGQEAARKYFQKYNLLNFVISVETPLFKDVNHDLLKEKNHMIHLTQENSFYLR